MNKPIYLLCVYLQLFEVNGTFATAFSISGLNPDTRYAAYVGGVKPTGM